MREVVLDTETTGYRSKDGHPNHRKSAVSNCSMPAADRRHFSCLIINPDAKWKRVRSRCTVSANEFLADKRVVFRRMLANTSAVCQRCAASQSITLRLDISFWIWSWSAWVALLGNGEPLRRSGYADEGQGRNHPGQRNSLDALWQALYGRAIPTALNLHGASRLRRSC